MRDYSAARSILSLVEFACWAGVLIGVIVAFSSVGVASRGFGTPGILAAIPGIAIGLLSLFGVALAQMGRAGVDTAEYGQQALKVARDQLEVSKQGLKLSQQQVQSFAQRAKETPVSDKPSFGQINTTKPENNTEDNAASATKNPFAPRRDENGFLVLNEEGSLLEYRGRRFSLSDGGYDLAGQNFTNLVALKKYLNNLKDLSA